VGINKILGALGRFEFLSNIANSIIIFHGGLWRGLFFKNDIKVVKFTHFLKSTFFEIKGKKLFLKIHLMVDIFLVKFQEHVSLYEENLY